MSTKDRVKVTLTINYAVTASNRASWAQKGLIMGELTEQDLLDLQAKIGKMLSQTELGGNSTLAYQFSFAEKGDSAYSFGILQFDVGARDDVRKFLKDNGFTDDEIGKLAKSEKIAAKDLAELNKKLRAIAPQVDAFTTNSTRSAATKIDALITYVQKRNAKIGRIIKDETRVQLALLDFDNQFDIGGLSLSDPKPNTMLAYLCGKEVTLTGGKIQLGETITAEDVQIFIDRTTFASQETNKTSVKTRSKSLIKALDDLSPVTPGKAAAPKPPDPGRKK